MNSTGTGSATPQATPQADPAAAPVPTSVPAPPAAVGRRPRAARPLESVVFSAAMLGHRLPWTDAPARLLGLDALTREGATRQLLAHLRRTHGGAPVRIGTPFGSFLVPLTPEDTAHLLARGDADAALGPAVRLTASGHRRGLYRHTDIPAEALPSAAEVGGLLADDVRRLLEGRLGDGTIGREDWCTGTARMARRVVVGAAAAEDRLLSEVLRRAGEAVGSREQGRHDAALLRRLGPYLEGPDPASVAGRIGSFPAADAVAAIAHLLDVVSRAAADTAAQALALLAVEACDTPARAVASALGHYPPIGAVAHPVRSDFVWEGLAIAAGTEVLAMPARLREAPAPDHDGAGRSDAAGPSPLCGAPTPCTGADFAERVAGEIVRGVAAHARPVLIAPRFPRDRLPHGLDPETLRVAFGPGAGTLPGPRGAGIAARAAVTGRGCAPAAYGSLAAASATQLDRHAAELEQCAADSGWNSDAAGEQFRTVLLGHAERCARAAADVRRAARRLAD
ncbi:hypothetical protein ABT084_00730 [Streptomyces sp. NPDC002138]|uniref:hypothetical protein n=1 Tax=Streptomyces sp. NPDC002138 TaxID=3154410 RepID=UPI00331D49DA